MRRWEGKTLEPAAIFETFTTSVLLFHNGL